MRIKLFYKDYDCKLNLAAIKMFKESTGKDLLGTLTAVMECFITSNGNGESVMQRIVGVSNVIDQIDASQLFYCLIKQSNKAVTLAEIEDAVFHSGVLPSIDDGDDREPYQAVLYKLAIDANEYHNTLANEKKP